MSDQPEESRAGELLRAIGDVPAPQPRVLDDAREALWAAVASAMLRIEPSGGQATATERPSLPNRSLGIGRTWPGGSDA